ncbi:hypothetical protein [Peribacillus sp. TH24]|uniref:hypothetical protein n=1 Tax=Peribacillus sp. TH24 TaxID=2798483 RepID=UPI001911E559|nr:hypothetical protein [Peribacillus sp. TH24]MBK5442836.1 hypothetical protein [Peribacillus sp. TH24]
MIRIFVVILLTSLMLIGCSSQSNVKTSNVKASKEGSEYNDIAEDIYQTNKNDNKQTVILEIDSK